MKIVLVDPSRVILKVTAGYLEPAGYDVVAYTDGSLALERIRTDDTVEVLVTSLEPHGMTGLKLCAESRRAVGGRRALHVIVMSSSSEGRRMIEALDSGADDFMGKPPEPEEFLARLRVAKRATTVQRTLIRLATVDALTGVLNRRAFFETAMAENRRPDGVDAVAILDIDRFKQVNDTYGHAAGDAAIQAVARIASEAGFVLGRLGGEEFAMLMSGLSPERAVALCETTRAGIAALTFPDIDPAFRLTCSFGVCDWRRDEAVDDALKRADIALYAAKTGGRNRVVSAAFSDHGDAAFVPLGALDPGRRAAVGRSGA